MAETAQNESEQDSVPSGVIIRAGSAAGYEGKQRLSYLERVSAQNAGAKALCMSLLRVPPGGSSAVHLHQNHESAAYVISGVAEMLHGEGLREPALMRAGDFVYIPAGSPHLVRNPSQTEQLTGILARTDPNEQESVVLLPELEAVVPPPSTVD
jgi:uncharacterized RmlC-like cupin family protein